MSDSDAREGAPPDELAGRLRDAHRLLAGLRVPAEVRIRLNLRLVAICTTLKMTDSSKEGCARRLDQLLREAEQEEANSGDEV
jgi:hypothetical protein